MILCFSVEDDYQRNIYVPNVCFEKNPADTRKKSKLVANAILLSTDQKHTSVNLNAADPFRGISFTALSEFYICELWNGEKLRYQEHISVIVINCRSRKALSTFLNCVAKVSAVLLL